MANENHNIWALLVGINRYRSYAVSPLVGCVNDVTSMQEFLTGSMGVPAQQVKTLVNGEATRAAILRNFKEFLVGNPAIPHGSQLLFQFSGHGSQMPDNTGTEPDGLDETIVPYNSRTGQVFDIPDKTLAALIERLAEEKGPHITVILDCCHSGSGTRMIAPGGKATTRRAPADSRKPPANLDAAFLQSLSRISSQNVSGGNPGYSRPGTMAGDDRTVDSAGERSSGPAPGDGDVNAVPVMGTPLGTPQTTLRTTRSGWAVYHPNHVLLAGCLDREESNEYYPPGEEPHGALTWFSLQYLRSKPSGATYADWHAYVLQKVPALFSDQTPQCEGAVRRTIFGDAMVESAAPSGVPEQLLRKSSAPPRQQVLLQPSGGEPGLLFLEEVRAQILGHDGNGKPSPFLELPEKPTKVPALIVAVEESGVTIRDEKGRLLVSPGDNPTCNPARTVSALESIARYRVILQLSGEIPSRLQGKFSLRLLRCTALSGDGISATSEIPQTPGETLTIPYFPEEKSSNLYAQEITNLSNTDVYPHLFILNPDFSIYRLYPVAGQQELLKAGHKLISGMTGSGGAPLELYLPGDQPGEVRWDESREVLKLMVTTSPCDLAMLEQDPLEVPPVSGGRGTRSLSPLEALLGRKVSGGSTRGKPARLPAGEELATAELAYRLVRHTPAADLHGDAATVELGRGFSLAAPAGFTGRISLDTMEGTRRGLAPGEGVKLPPALTGEWLTPVTRSTSRGLSEQPLLLTVEAGEASRRVVSPQNPLRLHLPGKPSSNPPATPHSGHPGDPASGFRVAPHAGLPVDSHAGLPVDSHTGFPDQDYIPGETISAGERFPSGQAYSSGENLRSGQALSSLEEDFLAVAFDGEDYLPVGYSAGPGQVDIVALPPAVSGGGDPTRSIGGALRLFLCRKLGRPEKNSGLRLVELTQGGLRYRDPVPAIFHSGDRVALFVHGFLSQSAGIARELVPLLEGMTPAYTRFLTWDYESFGTGVEASGAALATALRQKCGLAHGDGITLHVFAHGPGALVARCMTEIAGGDAFTDGMILAGPPNLGTPIANISRAALYLLSGAIGNISSLPLAGILAWPFKELYDQGEGWKDMTTTSEALARLNGLQSPATIPYLVLAGKCDPAGGEGARLNRLAHKILGKSAGLLIGEKENDGMIGLKSMKGVRNGTWPRLKVLRTKNHHFGYFTPSGGATSVKAWLRELS